MNKVTTINLSGRAFQLEEKAYDALHGYLESARRELHNDPDKEEIMQDFEQAIADKCDSLLNSNKNVITFHEVEQIIDAMGSVETDDTVSKENESQTTEENTTSSNVSQPPKRLYTDPDGAYVGGVCSGLAAYLNVDVTIVRLIFVILTFVTSGFWILVYVLLMVVLPAAKTPEQKAELRGERFTAQDIINKSKQKYAELGQREHWEAVGRAATPALTRAGQFTHNVVRLFFRLMSIFFSVMAAMLTSVWIATSIWLLTGHLHLTDQLSTIPRWALLLGDVSVYIVMVWPIVMLAFAFDRVAYGKFFNRGSGRLLAVLIGFWTLAICTLAGLAGAYSSQARDYERTHAYFTIDGHQVCVNRQLCYPDRVPQDIFTQHSIPLVPSNNVELPTSKL